MCYPRGSLVTYAVGYLYHLCLFMKRIRFQSHWAPFPSSHAPFYLSPLTADSHRLQPITAQLTSMSWQICERKKRLHPHEAFWKMPTGTVWSSDERRVSMRTGLMCLDGLTSPSHTLSLSFFPPVSTLRDVHHCFSVIKTNVLIV